MHISTEKAPAAIGPYSQAVRAETLVFVSGQLPIDPATGAFAGETRFPGETIPYQHQAHIGGRGDRHGPRGKNDGVPQGPERFCGHERGIRDILYTGAVSWPQRRGGRPSAQGRARRNRGHSTFIGLLSKQSTRLFFSGGVCYVQQVHCGTLSDQDGGAH